MNNFKTFSDVDECGQMLCNDICKNDDGGFQCKCVPGRHLYTEDTRVVKQKTLWPNKTCIGMLLYLQSHSYLISIFCTCPCSGQAKKELASGEI